jgi:hypothetical protein
VLKYLDGALPALASHQGRPNKMSGNTSTAPGGITRASVSGLRRGLWSEEDLNVNLKEGVKPVIGASSKLAPGETTTETTKNIVKQDQSTQTDVGYESCSDDSWLSEQSSQSDISPWQSVGRPPVCR